MPFSLPRRLLRERKSYIKKATIYVYYALIEMDHGCLAAVGWLTARGNEQKLCNAFLFLAQANVGSGFLGENDSCGDRTKCENEKRSHFLLLLYQKYLS